MRAGVTACPQVSHEYQISYLAEIDFGNNRNRRIRRADIARRDNDSHAGQNKPLTFASAYFTYVLCPLLQRQNATYVVRNGVRMSSPLRNNRLSMATDEPPVGGSTRPL